MAIKTVTTRLVATAVDRLSKPLSQMSLATRRHASTIRSDVVSLSKLRGNLKLIQDYKKQEQALSKADKQAKIHQATVRKLKAEYKSSEKPTQALTRALEAAQKRAQKSSQEFKAQKAELADLRNALGDAGFSIRDLSGEQDRLTASINKANAALGEQQAELRQSENAAQRAGRANSQLTDQYGRVRGDAGPIADHAQGRADINNRGLARSAVVGVSGYGAIEAGRSIVEGVVATVTPAIAAEAAFALVEKNADFDKQSGEDVKFIEAMKTIAADSPFGYQELMKIAELGAQTGMTPEQIEKFVKPVLITGVGFDMPADKVGGSMATITSTMGMADEALLSYMDLLNYLTNEGKATGSNLLEFITRTQGLAMPAGFSPEELAVIGAAAENAGFAAEVSATSLNNMIYAFAEGDKAPDSRVEAWGQLGVRPEQIQKSFNEDSMGTLLWFIKAINEQPAEQRISIAESIGGRETRAILPMLSNPDILTKNIKLSHDTDQIEGSITREYQTKALTTDNQLKVLSNKAELTQIEYGEKILGDVRDFSKSLGEILDYVRQWAKENPELARTLGLAVSAVGAFVSVMGGVLIAAGALGGTLYLTRGLFKGFGGSLRGAGGAARTAADAIDDVAAKMGPQSKFALGAFRMARLLASSGIMLWGAWQAGKVTERKPDETDEDWAIRQQNRMAANDKALNEFFEGAFKAVGAHDTLVDLGVYKPYEQLEKERKEALESITAEKISRVAEIEKEIAKVESQIEAVKGTPRESLSLPVLERELVKFVDELEALRKQISFKIGEIESIRVPDAIGSPGQNASQMSIPAISGKRALGGSMMAGSVYEVGERGREWIVPRFSAHVISNELLTRSERILEQVRESIGLPRIRHSGASAGSSEAVLPTPTVKLAPNIQIVIENIGQGAAEIAEDAKWQIYDVLEDMGNEIREHSFQNESYE